MINRKAKGTKAERELIKAFNENGWSAIRTAGSGSSKYPAPDILAGNAMRRIAVECKTCKDKKKYLSCEDIEQLKEFSTKFGAESWVGIRFGGEEWYFLMLEDLENTGKCFAVSRDLARLRGLTVSELLQIENNF